MKQKNFKEIYETIYANVGQKMEQKRKAVLMKKVLAFIIAIVIWVAIVSHKLIPSVEILCCVFVFYALIVGFITYKMSKSYRKLYKEQIIKEIVEQSNSSFVFNYNGGISSSEYAESKFDWGWDRYSTEDLITGELEDGSTVKMAQVHTEEEHRSTDSDGHTTTSYVTTFLGLYGIIKLKTATRADFMIKNNSKFAKFRKNRIEMESAEFEKYYDVYSNYSINSEVRQNAMEILTPEAIEEFVKIRNLFKRALNVRVYQNKIFFRIEVGDIFEAPTFKNSMNFEMLRKYFYIIDVPRMIYETLIDNILVMYGDSDAKERRNIAKMTDSQREEYNKIKKAEEEASYFSHK